MATVDSPADPNELSNPLARSSEALLTSPRRRWPSDLFDSSLGRLRDEYARREPLGG